MSHLPHFKIEKKNIFLNVNVASAGQNRHHGASQNTKCLPHLSLHLDNGSLYRRPKCFERIIQLHVTLQQNNTKRQSQHSARQFTVHLTVIMQI